MKMMMKKSLLPFLLSTLVLLLAPTVAWAQQVSSEEVLTPVTSRHDLYPADADAKKEIQEALQLARTQSKRVILIFGGNWCYDCHVLDQALHEGAAGKLVKENYLLVHVDIGEGDKNLDLVKKYNIPLEKGVPALAVLKSDGGLIYWSGVGEFEAARSMTKSALVAFLEHWKETRP